MAKSTPSIGNMRVVGALFEDPKDAIKAAEELREKELGPVNTVEPTTYPRGSEAKRREALQNWGYAEKDVTYFDRDIQAGKVLVSTEVDKSQVPQVIQILNKNGSHYNPDGS